MKKIIFFCFFLLNHYFANAQNKEQEAALLQNANSMAKAFIAKDYRTFLQYTYPDIITSKGGIERLLKETTKGFNELEAEGVSFLNVRFENPSPILRVDKELQCTLLEIITMKVPNGKLTTFTTQICISADNGKNWYFIDPAGTDLDFLRKYYPNLSPELALPTPQDPIFEEDIKN